ncbi:MAG: DUF1573 domain-containing protein [Planctomycetota bacterium]
MKTIHWLAGAVLLSGALACERVNLAEPSEVGDAAETSSTAVSKTPTPDIQDRIQASGYATSVDRAPEALRQPPESGHQHADGTTHADENPLAELADAASGPPPSIVFESLEHDFGRIYQGEKREHTYQFVNEGEGDLIIKDVRPTCGCTVGDVSSKFLRPGEKATIDIDFDSTKFSGPVTKFIKVFSNDPQRQVLDLKFTAEIVRLFETNPPLVNFLDVYKGDTPEKSVTITATDGSDFEVQELVPNSPFLDMSFEKTMDGENHAVRVDITVKNTSVVQNLLARPVLKIDHPRMKEVTFAVRANIQPNVAFEPNGNRLTFGDIPRGQASEQTLTIRNLESEPLEITDLKIESNLDVRTKLEDGTYKKYIQAELEEVKPGQEYRIVLRASDDIPDRYFHGRLTFSTNNPDVPNKMIAFHGFIRDDK